MIIDKLHKMANYLSLFMALMRGTYFIVYYRIFSRNIRISFPFIAYANVRIEGPGKVIIGKRCSVVKNVFKGLTIITYSDDAQVTVGNRCLLGGLTIRCNSAVEIGNKLMTAVSLVQDFLFTDDKTKHEYNDNGFLYEALPIKIEDNVWLGGHARVLGGSVIKKDSVIAACSTLYKTDINEYSLYSGNFKRPLPIRKLIEMRSQA